MPSQEGAGLNLQLADQLSVQKPAQQMRAEKKPVEKKPVEKKPVEKKPVEKKSVMLPSRQVEIPVTVPQPPARQREGQARDWGRRVAVVRGKLAARLYAEAGRVAQTLADDFPEQWEAWFLLGTAQLAQGQMAAADGALERASRLNGRVARIWIQRAILAQERGDHATAISLLGEARRLEPGSPQIYLNLGYSYDAQVMPAEAEANYRHFVLLTEGDRAYAAQRKAILARFGEGK